MRKTAIKGGECRMSCAAPSTRASRRSRRMRSSMALCRRPAPGGAPQQAAQGEEPRAAGAAREQGSASERVGGQRRGVRVKELEIQTKTYLEEARRLKEVSRLQAVEKEHALGVLRAQHADTGAQGGAERGAHHSTRHHPSSQPLTLPLFLQMYRSYGGSAAPPRRMPPWTMSLAAGWTRTKCCVRRSANCRAAVQASGVRRNRSKRRRRRRAGRPSELSAANKAQGASEARDGVS